MVWLISAFIILIIICVLLFLFSTLKVKFEYKRIAGQEHFVQINLFLYGISIWKKSYEPSDNKQIQPKKVISNVRKIMKEMKRNKAWLKTKVTLDEFRWDTLIGTGEVISTSISAGSFWALKENLLLLLYPLIHIEDKPIIYVKPMYNDTVFQTKVYLQGHIRLYAMYHLYKYFKKVFDE